MLLALVRAGLLDQDPDTRRYYLGPEVYVLGTLASARFGIHPMSLRSLVRLSQETGDTAFLSVPRDVYSICVHREEGPYPIRIHALHAGDRHPLGVGAGSLALLSALPDHEVEEVLAANAEVLAERYPHHPTHVLRTLVQETRAKGYALNPGLLLPGSWGVGVPIRASDGRPIGALSIAAIESRLGEARQKEIASLLKKEATWIETRLGEVGSSERHMRRKDRVSANSGALRLTRGGDARSAPEPSKWLRLERPVPPAMARLVPEHPMRLLDREQGFVGTDIAPKGHAGEDLRHQLRIRSRHHRIGIGDDEDLKAPAGVLQGLPHGLRPIASIDVALEVPFAHPCISVDWSSRGRSHGSPHSASLMRSMTAHRLLECRWPRQRVLKALSSMERTISDHAGNEIHPS